MQNYCVDCGKPISAKATRCRSCANIKMWDEQGRSPISRCIDCGKEISQGAKRCRKCSGLSKRPPNFCIACGKEISYESTRCRTCSNKSRSKPKTCSYCVDCGSEITKGAKRCWHCFILYVKKEEWKKKQSLAHIGQEAWNAGTAIPKPKRYCKDCGDEIKSDSDYCHSCSSRRAWSDPNQREYQTQRIREANQSPERCRKISEALKAAWARGAFDNAFQSPTQPELDVMEVLDGLDIDYIFQYRIESYLYDFYLPELEILVEYDGWRWHHSDWAVKNGAIERDERKNQLANEKNIKLIRLGGTIEQDLTLDEIHLQLYQKLS